MLYSTYRKSGLYSNVGVHFFESLVASLFLIDVDLSGSRFTRQNSTYMCRIDRALISHCWLSSFPRFQLSGL